AGGVAGPRARRADAVRPRRQPAGAPVRPRPAGRPDRRRLHHPAVCMSLRVLEPGLQSLVVDFGRPGWRSLGVALGGAADRYSLALGNALVGNLPDAAALEVCLAGPTLQAGCDLGCVVFGAPFDIFRGDERLPTGQT